MPPLHCEAAGGSATAPPGADEVPHPDRGRRLSGWLCAPAGVWMLVCCALPLAGLLATSFLTRGPDGEITLPITLENYRRLLGFGVFGFDPVYPWVLVRSLFLGLWTTGLCLLIALPLTLWLVRLPERLRTVALTLVVIPFWTNLLVRSYAWQMLLAPESLPCRLLRAAGLLGPDQGLYPGWGAVLIGMVCDFLPFMVLPLYACAERLDWRLVEAALDLGAGRWQTFRHALWPQLLPGITAGSVLVFLPATGQFVVPDLLGGARLMFLGNLLQQQFGVSRDWPFGAAVATAALALVCAGLWLLQRRQTRSPIARP